jgi:uncharacterized membrane protein HdeD (DUF308 family)
LIAGSAVISALGWMFLTSGLIGLVTSFFARHLPGIFWSLVSALLGIVVGVALIAQTDLYSALVGWPLGAMSYLKITFALFFLIEGVASIVFASEQRFSGRWIWMLSSGVLDLILAGVVILGVPGSSAWAMALLVGINMIAGGVALVAMSLPPTEPSHEITRRAEHYLVRGRR